jgi:uncharacterized protein YukE
VGTEFKVDAHELRRLSLTCWQLSQALEERQLPSDAIEGISGAHEVERSYDAFVSHWSDGLWKTRDHLQELGDRLSAAADAYAGTDGAVSQAAGGGRGGG